MKQLIGFSTGTIKYVDDINTKVRILKTLNPEGIELSFPFESTLLNTKLSNETLNYLKTLSHVSIHAPWKEVTYTKELINKIKKISELVKAKNVVFHTKDLKLELIINSGLPFSLENNDERKTEFKTFKEVNEFLEKNKKIRLTLDIAHALQADPEHINEFLKIKNIIEIHFSILHEGKHAHFHSHAGIKEKKLLKKLPNEPIIIESGIHNENELSKLEKEIRILTLN